MTSENNNYSIIKPSKPQIEHHVSLQEIVGRGYKEFWDFKGRYRVVKGSRGSKKSTTTALWMIYHMMELPLANSLIIRRLYCDHKDSTYAQIKWAINRMGVSNFWGCKVSPLELIYRPTGQKIIFRGMDDPTSITSITVEKGFICWAWFEEASQILSEDDFNKVDMSIRGQIPEEYFKQITLTFNPWTDKFWAKKRFFDTPDPRTLAITTTYRINEFLDEKDIQQMELLPPRRKRIEADGEWGIAEGMIYENWAVQSFDIEDIRLQDKAQACFGLDFGYTTDPSAFVAAIVFKDRREIYIFDEFYKKGMPNREIAELIKYKGYSKERIVADSAEPKSIDEIKRCGITRITPAVKGADSVMHGIQALQDYHMIVHPTCTNTEIELSNYCLKKNRDGTYKNEPEGGFDHIMDALRYAVTDKLKGSGVGSYKGFERLFDYQ